MADFEFLQNPISKKWIVLAPRRSKRPDVAKVAEPVCPFCPGREGDEREVYRVPASQGEALQGWLVRVLPNKFPFAPIHEVIVHSPDHHKNFGELPLHQVELIVKTYRQRYQTHQDKGRVYIFHNRGEEGGESLPHPHTQLAVVPFEVSMDIPTLDVSSSEGVGPGNEEQMQALTPHLYLFCPKTSQWPDEVWIVPKKRGEMFGAATDGELADIAYTLARLVQIFDLRHGHEFPFNFYIYPGKDWYLRLIPRLKSLGGFEVGTGVFVNTQDPKETIRFIKDHFEQPDAEKIRSEYQAEYGRGV